MPWWKGAVRIYNTFLTDKMRVEEVGLTFTVCQRSGWVANAAYVCLSLSHTHTHTHTHTHIHITHTTRIHTHIHITHTHITHTRTLNIRRKEITL